MARRIDTHIDIEAPRERVWNVLSDWPGYGHWNPFVVRLSGRPKVGARLEVALIIDGTTMRFTPRLLDYDEGRRFCWRGQFGVPGVVDGEHSFELEDLGEGRTRLHHAERFTGILVGLTWGLFGSKTERGFVKMNEALKRRCETRPGSSPSSA